MTRPPKTDDDEAALFDLPLHRPAAPVARRAAPAPPAKSGEEPFGPLVESPSPPWETERGDSGTAEAPAIAEIPPTPEARPVVPIAPDPPPDGSSPAEPVETAAPQISFAMTLPFEENKEATETVAVTPEGEPVRAGFGARLVAGLIDLTMIGAGLAVAATGAVLLGVPPRVGDWPAFLVLGLTFSFLYYVIPLAFWGRSGGMATRKLFVRSNDGRPLSFGQAAQRWLAALLTVATLGLPTFLALTPRSLADRLSNSQTYAQP